MAAPTTFDRQTSFALFSSENPREPHSGVDLDTEFNAVKISLDETQDALADIRESDGSLKRGIVTTNSLAPDLAIGYVPQGVWSTGLTYTADTDVVFHGTKLYLAQEDHTSGTFATDLAAGKWLETADLGVQVLDDDTVDTQHLVDAAVETAKIANSAVTTAKIQTAAVTTAKLADLNVTEAKLAAAVVNRLVPAGTVVDYAGTTAPTGWEMCYGQIVLDTDYPALYAAIGATYNTGGETVHQFRLPDLRGYVVAGKDNMGGTSANRLTDADDGLNGDTLGDTGGSETQTLVTGNLPPYTPAGTNGTSAVTIGTQGAGAIVANGGSLAATGGGATWGATTLTGTAAAQTFTGTAQGGTSTAFGVIQPTIILNKIIKAH